MGAYVMGGDLRLGACYLVVEQQPVGGDGDADEDAVAHLRDEEAARHRLVADLVRLCRERQLHLLDQDRPLLHLLWVEELEARRLVAKGTHPVQRLVLRTDAAQIAGRLPREHLARTVGRQMLDLRLQPCVLRPQPCYLVVAGRLEQ